VFVGGVAEWSNAPVLKTDEGESPPRVRIPVPPPHYLLKVKRCVVRLGGLFLFNFVDFEL
jgi:hypothetical protein